jgi:hypothetical protein
LPATETSPRRMACLAARDDYGASTFDYANQKGGFS